MNGTQVKLLAATAVLAGVLSPVPSIGSPGEDSACDAYWNLQYDRAIELAQAIIASSAAEQDKISAYQCKACSHVERKQFDPAKDTIAGMLSFDPTSRFSPDTTYPPAVIELYNAVRDSLYPGTTDINTVAVGDFEDNSIFQGKFGDLDFSLFQRALIHTINADLAEATDLKLVDRQRIEQITQELKLNQSGFVNPEQSVKAGELLGAQSFIFGQYMILSKDKVRIDARVVRTATGEIVLTKQVTGDFSGNPEKFLELEKNLVIALAEGIDKIRSSGGTESDLRDKAQAYFEQKDDGIEGRKGYVESKFLEAEALSLEDKGKFAEAQSVWKQVLDADPENAVAPVRIRVLDTLLQG
ncbi:MAG: hypothetical protein R3E97_12455 [Candidatus Eisenbacteria bacterium]